MTTSTTHRSLGSKDWMVSPSNRKGEHKEERAMALDLLRQLYNIVKDLFPDREELFFRRLKGWFRGAVHPTEVAEKLSLASPDVSPVALDAWLRYAFLYQESVEHISVDQIYESFKGRHSDAEVFKRLTSIYNFDSGDPKRPMALMHNKLAEKLSSSPDVAASNWMANKLKALQLPPAKIADMLGLRDKNLLCELHHSAAAWIGFVGLLHEEKSDLAIPIKEAWSLLTGNMNMQEKYRFFLLVWPDLPAKLKARVRQARTDLDLMTLFKTG
uniref:RxLR effector candidate protein n=1 Tax=Hyaloperonospora arabidopsidis (strain Emoy2) TaxID=559515 RepID=M4B2F0_HYAAE